MIKSIQLAFEKFLILIIVNKLLVIINYFMLKKGPAINENGETYHGNNSTGTKEQLLNNLKNKSLSGEKIELILEIIWEEIFDEESLEELVWKTKEELERIKKDKNLILEITWNKSICISALMELREVLSKDYRKFIFDLDYTLLIPDWSCEDDYFRENIAPEEQKDFFDKKQDILNEYETRFPKYNLKTLSDYFRNYGFIVSEKVIEGWMKYNGENIKDEIPEGVIEFLKYLKEKGKEVVILTNWFSKTQILRLKRTWLMKYVDKIVAGDDAMKPNIKSFELAIWETDKKDCIMIGDSPKSDKAGAKDAEIDCCIVGKGYSISNLFDIIRKVQELRDKDTEE